MQILCWTFNHFSWKYEMRHWIHVQLSRLHVTIERLRDLAKSHACIVESKVTCWASLVIGLLDADWRKQKDKDFFYQTSYIKLNNSKWTVVCACTHLHIQQSLKSINTTGVMNRWILISAVHIPYTQKT